MIEWKIEKRLLSTLREHPSNPRKLSKHDADHLKRSIQKFGIVDKLTVTPDGQIIGGHQRKRILQQLKVKEVDCNVPSRDLTPEEIDELNIRLNRNTGEWDWEVMANSWNLSDLVEWGFNPKEFEIDIAPAEEVDSEDEEDEETQKTCSKCGSVLS